jgi:DNA replication protein DnaC
VDLVVLGEFGYLPFAQSSGQLLLHLVSRASMSAYRSSSPPISPSVRFNGRDDDHTATRARTVLATPD